MKSDTPPLHRLRAALHPLEHPPRTPGWNRDALADLLDPARPPVEAAVLVGLVERDDGLQVLLTRRTDGLRHHAGQVSFPGGRIEPVDAGPVAAALREAEEEIGLPPAQVTPLGYLDPLLTVTGFRVVPLVGFVASDYEARPDPNEVAEVFEVPLGLLLDPANLLRHTLDYRGQAREIVEFRYPDRRIWGATAMMLLNLRERLYADGMDDAHRR